MLAHMIRGGISCNNNYDGITSFLGTCMQSVNIHADASTGPVTEMCAVDTESLPPTKKHCSEAS